VTVKSAPSPPQHGPGRKQGASQESCGLRNPARAGAHTPHTHLNLLQLVVEVRARARVLHAAIAVDAQEADGQGLPTARGVVPGLARVVTVDLAEHRGRYRALQHSSNIPHHTTPHVRRGAGANPAKEPNTQ
jgi:hypothetical protein